MLKKRVKILNEFKMPMPLLKADAIKFLFPYEDGRTLEKKIAQIVDAEKGIVEFELSDFELQGLKEGSDQNFMAEIEMDGFKYTVLFAKGLNITVENERKSWK